MNSILTYEFLRSTSERAVWRVRVMVSSVDLYGLYTNCSVSSESGEEEAVTFLTKHFMMVEVSAS